MSSRARSSKASGDLVEANVVQRVPPLRSVPDATAEWHDAVVDGCLSPSALVHFVGVVVLEDGSRVEIKGCQRRLASGQRGRFHIRRGQHAKLLEAGATYLFAVYEPANDHRVAAMTVVPATCVDELIDERWTDAGEGRSDDEAYHQLGWTNVIQPSQVGVSDE